MKCKKIKGNKDRLTSICADLGARSKLEKNDVITTVEKILADVRTYGDEGLLQYTRKFDCESINKEQIRVTSDEIEEALSIVPDELIEVLKKSAANIKAFHDAQLEKDYSLDVGNGSYIGMKVRPISVAGIYVPGGTAPLPSTVLMNVIPAKCAGVPRIVLCTPPNNEGKINPTILAAAMISGVDEIYKAGGAQAIAAMTYGTKTIPRVDKITGPGNIFVNTAKRLVFGQVDIDMFAGPSEILILADKFANPKYIAADMLSQAEHDKIASAILLVTDEILADKVMAEVDRQSELLSRKDILSCSLPNYCAVIVVPDIDTAIVFCNELAPEHLEICTKNPEKYVDKIQNAGAVFLGSYSPESLGDYYAGPNHTLPTSGTARFFSPLNAGEFLKKMSIISYTKESLANCYKDIAMFAEAESLDGHAKAARIRFEDVE